MENIITWKFWVKIKCKKNLSTQFLPSGRTLHVETRTRSDVLYANILCEKLTDVLSVSVQLVCLCVCHRQKELKRLIL